MDPGEILGTPELRCGVRRRSRRRHIAVRRRLGPLLGDLIAQDLLDPYRDIVGPASPRSCGDHSTPSCWARPEMGLDGLARELRDRYSSPLGFTAESGVEVIRQLDRCPLHSMPAYHVQASCWGEYRTHGDVRAGPQTVAGAIDQPVMVAMSAGRLTTPPKGRTWVRFPSLAPSNCKACFSDSGETCSRRVKRLQQVGAPCLGTPAWWLYLDDSNVRIEAAEIGWIAGDHALIASTGVEHHAGIDWVVSASLSA